MMQKQEANSQSGALTSQRRDNDFENIRTDEWNKQARLWSLVAKESREGYE